MGAIRALRREPGFTCLAVLMLAVGIGANTAIFSFVNAVLLQPLPYAEPERLFALRGVAPAFNAPGESSPVNARTFVEWRETASSVERISVVYLSAANLNAGGEPEQVDVARVSPGFFAMLGGAPVLGREFMAREEVRGQSGVVVLTDALWRRRFGADPALVGKTVEVDGTPHTVVGILPAGFLFPRVHTLDAMQRNAVRPQLFLPAAFSPGELKELTGMRNWNVIARLKRGASREQAVQEFDAARRRLIAQAGETLEESTVAIPLLELMVGKSRTALLVAFGAVALVLLIVCVNVANLMLARGERRAYATAIRGAIGASRWQLMREAVGEAAALGAAGAAAGLAAAWWGTSFLVRSAPVDLPRLQEVGLSGRVLVFALAVTAASCLLFALIPAWRAGNVDPLEALKAGGRTGAGSRGGSRLRRTLVAAQAGLSAALLVLAGLLLNSFLRLMQVDKGFQTPGVTVADITLAGSRYREGAHKTEFYRRLLADLSSRPGVRAAGLVTALPLQGETWIERLRADEQSERHMTNVRFVAGDYFAAMGIPLRAGRNFSESDRGRKVTIVSQGVAQRLFPGQNALGRTVSREIPGDVLEIVGIVGDVRVEIQERPALIMYRPHWDWPPSRVSLVVRGESARMLPPLLRAALREADPAIPLARVRTMAEVVSTSVAERRFQMALALAFACTALMLTALGVYGVVSYSVARRGSELGIRAALGAGASDLYRLAFREGMLPVAAGLAAGIAAALAGGRLLASLLFEVGARDPATIAAVSLLLLGAGGAACLGPARRAAKTDPAAALRCE